MQQNDTPGLPAERPIITKEVVNDLERDILYRRQIERYISIAPYAYGTVLDCASGSGYGSYLLAKRTDVTHVHGLDIDADAIQEAQQEFEGDKITFHATRIEDFAMPADFLVSIETIEHLDDPTVLADLCDRTGIQEIILSYPCKKSTHYNKFHKWDLVVQDIADIFPKFMIVDTMSFTFDTSIVRLVRHEKDVIPERRWNRATKGAHDKNI